MTHPASPPGATRVVEVFADVWCPFTHVGLRRLVAQRARLGRDDVVIRVRAWPLELVNGEALADALVAHEIAALRAAVAPDLFRGFDPARFPSTTLPALALTAAAYARDDRTGEAVALALRTALFEERRDIADPSELAEVARAHDLDLPHEHDEASIRADWDEGRRRGVIGSPHFFVDGHGFFCPTLKIRRIRDAFEITTNAVALEEFVAEVFDEPHETTATIAG